MVWVHWVVYNMPPDTKSLPENAGKARLPQGALLGLNDFRKTGYGGPCPPIGRHGYFHKLYALDITLDLRSATKSQVERAMLGHILANAELIGTYQNWELRDDGRRIERTFRFRNFEEALSFVSNVGNLAETQGHHPDVSFGWGYATISLRTKKIKGLHENDFIMASKIDRIFDGPDGSPGRQ